MDRTRTAVREVMRKVFGGKLPTSQRQGTAFGLALTREFQPAATHNPVLFAKPRTDESKELVAAAGIDYLHREFMIDFVVFEQVSETKWLPLVACESEMHERHGVGYSIDGENGYTFDFVKLLMFPAPTRVFAARVNTAWLDELEESLDACAVEYRDYWAGCDLRVVLLPSASRKLSEVRIGVGTEDGRLRFERLGNAAPATARDLASRN